MDAHLIRKASCAVPMAQRALSSGHFIRGCPLARLPLSTFETIERSPVHQLPDLTGADPHFICQAATFSYSWSTTHSRHTLDVVHHRPRTVLFICPEPRHRFQQISKALFKLTEFMVNPIRHSSYCKVDHSRSTGMRACYYRERHRYGHPRSTNISTNAFSWYKTRFQSCQNTRLTSKDNHGWFQDTDRLFHSV